MKELEVKPEERIAYTKALTQYLANLPTQEFKDYVMRQGANDSNGKRKDWVAECIQICYL